MDFLKYTPSYRSQCMAIFDSNLGQYFAYDERDEFTEFLDSPGKTSRYFVCIENGAVLACGGIHAKINSQAFHLIKRYPKYEKCFPTLCKFISNRC